MFTLVFGLKRVCFIFKILEQFFPPPHPTGEVKCPMTPGVSVISRFWKSAPYDITSVRVHLDLRWVDQSKSLFKSRIYVQCSIVEDVQDTLLA